MGNVLNGVEVEDEEEVRKMSTERRINQQNQNRIMNNENNNQIMSSEQLEKMMNQVLLDMDLPPDKLKIVKQLPEEKRKQILDNLRHVTEKQPPEYYIKALKTYIDGLLNQKSSVKKNKIVNENSTQLIKNLEVSLRTNRIDWVHKFLDAPFYGLDVLVEYLQNSLNLMNNIENEDFQLQSSSLQHHFSFIHNLNANSDNLSYNSTLLAANNINTSNSHNTTINTNNSTSSGSNNGTLSSYRTTTTTTTTTNHTHNPSLERRQSRLQRNTKKRMNKMNMGEATDDVHECVRCLRAIMSHQYGFHMVIAHHNAISAIAFSLKHKEYRTKSLVLELLAAVCLVDGGHAIVLRAFDYFKDSHKETSRFETLMSYFRKDSQDPDYNIDFMVACMQFINIIVHSTQNMNFRVHLQYEFTQLGLDDFLENKLRFNESDRLQVQIQAYLDNQFDVHQLIEEADAKHEALVELDKIKEELSIEKDKFNKVQDDLLNKITELQKDNFLMKQQIDLLSKEKDDMTIAIDTLKRSNKSGHASILTQNKDLNDTFVPPPAPPPPILGPSMSGFAPPPPPPPPPPPLMLNGSSKSSMMMPPPPPPGMAEPPIPTMTIKRKIETKYKLPNLNWIALKPQQVKGTVFCELDDEKLLKIIDFETFEELFKMGNNAFPMQNSSSMRNYDSPLSTLRRASKKPENITLLEPQRQRNLAISRRKILADINEVCKAINNLDLNALPVDQVDILNHFVPTEQEIKLFTNYIEEGKNIRNLSEEDQFLFALSKVERLSQKLNIMSFIGNFNDAYKNLLPQINAVISASLSIKQSKKLKKLLEIILAFGNYMNSSKRGPVYGFKLQSLETIYDTKTHDKRQTLLHYIVSTIQEKFSDLINFNSELTFIDKAATVSLENVQFDMNELDKGMKACRKEYEIRIESKQDIQILRDFKQKAETQFQDLQSKYKSSQELFSQCVEYFGEAPRTQSPNTFFSIFVKFIKAFYQAKIDNETRLKSIELMNANENASQTASPRSTLNKQNKNLKNGNLEMLKELKKRQPNRTRLNSKKEINIEDLIEEMNRGYITADAERRKRQRTQEIKKEFNATKSTTPTTPSNTTSSPIQVL